MSSSHGDSEGKSALASREGLSASAQTGMDTCGDWVLGRVHAT